MEVVLPAPKNPLVTIYFVVIVNPPKSNNAKLIVSSVTEKSMDKSLMIMENQIVSKALNILNNVI